MLNPDIQEKFDRLLQLLALQNSLSASYEATSMLAGLTLTKFLPAGG